MNGHAAINRIYRLVWSDRFQTWLAASEITRGRGKRSSTVGAVAAAGLLALGGAASAAGPPAPTQLPTGGNVVAGQASLSQSGAQLNVHQGSDRAVIDWASYNVGAGAQVNYAQPSTQSVTLNRVLDTQASQILGRITANGQVFLINPNGVYFGKTASVDVGGLVASTKGIGNEDFMAGRITLEGEGTEGAVINEGSLRAALGGYIALLAPEVRNEGLIVAQLGTVALASGQSVTLQFEGQRTLAGIVVEPGAIEALVENKGAVMAPGGVIILSARSLNALQGGVVRNSGSLEATGMHLRDGRIVLDASHRVENPGLISADAGADGSAAGSVSIVAPEVVNAGRISATATAAPPASMAAEAGSISVSAERFTQTADGVLDVSGRGQAGRVNVQASADIGVAGQVRAVGEVRGAAAQADGQPLAEPAEGGPAAPAVDAGTASSAESGTGGSIAILAGGSVTLQDATLDASGAQAGGQVHVEAGLASPAQHGPVPAPGRPGDPVPTTALLGNSTIGAGSRRGQGGSVTLTGEHVGLFDTAHIDASGATGGGNVRVGGDYQGGNPDLRNAQASYIAPDARITADAHAHGDGGRVIVWADGITRFAGHISAQGGAQGGDGGFSEVSGKGVLEFRGSVLLQAAAGRTGTLLLDPYNLTISTDPDSGTVGFEAAGDNSVLNVTTLQNALASANVTVTTGGGGSQAGNITVASPVGWFSTYTLTLEAYNDILVNANISAFEGSLTLIAGTGGASAGTGAIAVGHNARINLVNGNLVAEAKGNIAETGGTLGILQIGGTTALTSSAGSIMLESAGNRFAGAVSAAAGPSGAVSLVNGQALTLGTVSAGSGGVDIMATGSITGASPFSSSGGSVRLTTAKNSNGSIDLSGSFASGGAVELEADGVGTVSVPHITGDMTVAAVSAGGAITLGDNSTGALVFDAGGDTVITGNAGVNGQASGTVTVTGASITLNDAVRTHGGAVVLTSTSGGVVAAPGAHITTSATANSGTASGTVTATAANGLTLQNITTTGSAHNAGVGSNAAAVTLMAAAGDLRVGAITSTGGAASAGVTDNRNGGNAGNIVIGAAAGTVFLNGDLRAIGGTPTGAATRGLGGYIELQTPTVLTADRLVSSGDTSGNISFLSTVDSDATPRRLTVEAGIGDVLFDGVLGGTAPLSSLQVTSASRTDIERNVTTNAAAGVHVTSAMLRIGNDNVANGDGAVTIDTLAGNGAVTLSTVATYLDDAVTFTRGSGAFSNNGFLYSKDNERNDLTFNGTGGGNITVGRSIGGSTAGAAGKLGDILFDSVTNLTVSEHVSARSLTAVNGSGRISLGSDSYSQFYDGAIGLQLRTTGTANTFAGDENIRMSSNVTVSHVGAPIDVHAPNGNINFFSHADLATAGGDIRLRADAGSLTLGVGTDLTSNGGLISLTGVSVVQSYSESMLNAGSGKLRVDAGGGTVALYGRIVSTNADSDGTPAVLVMHAGGGGNAVSLRSVVAQTGTLQVGLVAGDTALAPSQTLAGAGDLALMSPQLRLRTAQTVSIHSAGDDSALSYTVTGTDAAGNPLVESIAGGNAGVVQTTGVFKTISSISSNGASSGAVSAGLTADDTINGSLFQYTVGSGTDRFDIKTLSAAAASAINVTSANNTIDELGSFSVGSSLDVRAKGRSAGMALTGDVTATSVTLMTGNGALVLGDRDITATNGGVTLYGRGLTQDSGSTISATTTVLIYGNDYTNTGLRGNVTMAGGIVAGNTSNDAVRIYRTGAVQLGNITAGTVGSRGGLRLGEDDWVDGAISQAPGTSIRIDRLSITHRVASSITLTNEDNEIGRVGYIRRAGDFSLFDRDTEGNGLQIDENIWDGALNNAVKVETLGALTHSSLIRGRGVTLSGASITSSGQIHSNQGSDGSLVLQAHGGNVTLTGQYYVSGSNSEFVIRRANNVQLGAVTNAGNSALELGVAGTDAALATSQAVPAAGNLTLDGSATTAGSASFGAGQRVALNSAGDDSGIVFTVTGTDLFGRAQTELITGSNAGTASGTHYFSTITQIAASGAAAANVSVGTAAELIAGNVTQTGRIESTTIVRGLVGGNVTLNRSDNSFSQIGHFTAGGNLSLYSASNPLTVVGHVESGTGNVSIEAAYGLTVAGAGSVNAADAAKGVTLRGSLIAAGHTLNVQGPVSAGTGGITISSGGAFTSSAAGTLASTGNVAVKTAWNGTNSYNLTLGGNVTAGVNGIQLTSSGTINQTGGILTTPGAVSGPDQNGGGAPGSGLPSARGAVTLNQANQVGLLGPFYVLSTAGGAFGFNDVSGGLILSGAIESSHGAVNLSTAGGALNLATYNVYAGGQAAGGANISLTGRGVIQSQGAVNATGGSLGDPRGGSSGGTITITGHDGTADGSIVLGGTLQTASNSPAAIKIRGTSALALPHVVAPNGSLVLGDGTAVIGTISGPITQSTGTALNIRTLEIGTPAVPVGSSAVLANSGNEIVQLGSINVGTDGVGAYGLDVFDASSGLVLTQTVTSAGGVRLRTRTGGGASGALALGAHHVLADGDIVLSGDGVAQSTASVVDADHSGAASTGGNIRVDAGGGAHNLTLAGTLSTDSASAAAIEIVNATNATLNVVSAPNGTVVLGELGRELSGTVSQTPTTGRVSARTLAGNAGVLALHQTHIDQIGPLVTTGALTLRDQGGSGTAGLKFVGDVTVGSTTLIESTDGVLDLDTHRLDASGSGLTLRGVGVAQATGSSVLANIAEIDGGSGSILLASALNDFTGQVGLTASGAWVSIRDANQLSLNALSGQLDANTSITAVAGTQLVLTPEDITTGSGSIDLRSLDGNLSTPGALTTGTGNVSLQATQGAAPDAGNVQVNRVITTGSGAISVVAQNEVNLSRSMLSASGDIGVSGATVTHSTGSSLAPLSLSTGGAGSLSVIASGTGGLVMGQYFGYQSDAGPIHIQSGGTADLSNISSNATVQVQARGLVQQVGSGTAIVADVLAVVAGHDGSIALNNAGNHVAKLSLRSRNAAGTGTGSGTLSYRNAGAVAVRQIETSGNASLVVHGAVSTDAEDGPGTVTAAHLSVKTLHDDGADISLTSSGNDVDSLTLLARNAADTAIAGNTTTPAATLRYTDANGMVVVGVQTLGSILLTAGGPVTQSGAIQSARLGLSGAGSFVLNSALAGVPINAFSVFASDATGAVDVSSQLAVSLGAVNPTGVTTGGAAFTMTAPSIDASAQTIDTRSATAGTAGGALTLTTTGIGADGLLTLGDVNTSGQAAAAASGGNGGAAGTITLTASGDTLTVAGSVTARGGAGDGSGTAGSDGTVLLSALNGAVSQANGGNGISAGRLLVHAARASQLLDQANDADLVSARINDAGEGFTYRSGSDYVVGGGQSGIHGIATQGGAVDIGSSDVAITLSEAVSTRGGSFSATGVRSFDSSSIAVSTAGDAGFGAGAFADGGALTISTTANGGSVHTGSLDSSGSSAAAAAQAGAITLTADGTLRTATINSQGGGSGDGGSVTLTGSTVQLQGSISTVGATVGGDITVHGAARLSDGDRSLNTGAGSGSVVFNGTLDSDGSARALSITAGSGDIAFNGAAGGVSKLGALNIVSAANVTVANTLAAVGFTQQAGSGSTQLAGTTHIDNHFSFTGENLAVNAALSAGGAVQIANAGQFSTNAAGDIQAAGGFTQSGAGHNALAGDIGTSGTGIHFATAVVLTGDISLNSQGGAVRLAGTVDSDGIARDLTVNADAGNVRFDERIGDSLALADLVVNSAGQTRFDAAVTAASVETDAPGSVLLNGGSVSTSGTQTYRDAITLGADTLLKGSIVHIEGTLAGANRSLDVLGNAVLGSAVTGLSTLQISGTTFIDTHTVSSADAQTYAGAVTLGTSTTLTAGDDDITFGSTVDSAANEGHDLSLAAGTGDISFAAAVGAGANGRLGMLAIASARDVTAQAISAAALLQHSGTGTTTLNGAVNTDGVDGVSLTGAHLALHAGITTTLGGTVSTQHSGTTHIAAAGDIVADGAVSLTAAGGIQTAGDITSSGAAVTLGSAVTLSGDVAINSQGGDINLAGPVNSAANQGRDLTLAAGAGDINLAGPIGTAIEGRLGTLNVTSAHDVTAAAMNLGALVQHAGTGTTTLNGAIHTNTAAGVSLHGQDLVVNAAITSGNAGLVAIHMAGAVDLAAAADINADGHVGIQAAAGINSAGDISSQAGDISIGSALVLTGDVALSTGNGGGSIELASTVDGDGVVGRSLRLRSGALSGQNFVAAVGGVQALDLLRIESAGVITQGGSAPIRAARLAIVSAGDVILDHGSNAVDVLAALLSGSAQLRFVDSTGLQIGVVDSGALQVIGISDGGGSASVSLTVGGPLTQAANAPILIDGDLSIDTTAFDAGNVSLKNTAAAGTVLDNTLIGGNFSLHSAGEVSQRLNANGEPPNQTDAFLQVGGSFDLIGPGQFVQGNSPDNLIGGGTASGAANVIRLYGVITLSINGQGDLVAWADNGTTTNTASIASSQLASGVSVISDSGGKTISPVANASAVSLNEANRIGGRLKITTQGTYDNQGDAVATGILQSTALQLADASFLVQESVANPGSSLIGAGRLDLSHAANSFSGTVSATATGMDAHLRSGTALNLGSVTAGHLIVELDHGATLDLTQAENALLRADTLLLRHMHSATLAGGNRVGTLAADLSGNLSLVNNQALHVGTVGGVVGVSAATGHVSLQTLSGDLVLDDGIAVAGPASITLATAARFINHAGANALAVIDGHWQVWSQSPTGDTLGGLAPQFKQYDADFGASNVLGSGNGLLYTFAPELMVSLVGSVQRVYDGTDAATLAQSNFSIGSGLVAGDAVVFTTAGRFDTRHAGSGKTVSTEALGIVSASANGGAVAVYGYQLASGSVVPSGAIGAITPASLTLSTSDVTRTYDGSLAAAGTAVVQAGSGTQLFAGDSLSGGSFAFTNANAGLGNKRVTVSGVSVDDGNDGGNYHVSYTDNTSSTIERAALTVSTSDVSRTYDGTLAAAGVAVVSAGTLFSNASNAGLQDSLSGGTFAFTDANAGHGNKRVTVSGVAVTDGNGGGNYDITYADNTTSTINPFAVSLGGTRTYDGTAVVNATHLTLGSLVGSETLTLGGSALMADKHVGSGKALDVSGLSLIGDGSGGAGLASNYRFTGGTHGVNITRAALSLSSGDVTKTYDGSLLAAGLAVVHAGSGTQLFAGDSLSGGSFAFTNANAGHGNKTVTTSGVTLDDGNGGGNYTVTYALNTTSTINPFAVSLSGTRVYDGSTQVSAVHLTLGSLVGSETLTLAGSALMADKHVGSGKALDVSGLSLIGDGSGGAGLASNYRFTGGTHGVNITRAALSLSSVDVTKTYDGSLLAAGLAVVHAGSGTQLFASDSLSGGSFAFTNANAGHGNKTVTTSGVTLDDGNGGGNYSVTYVDNTSSTIERAALTLSTSNVSRTYDGSLTAAGVAVVSAGTLFSNASNAGLQDSLSGGTFTFTNANAGNGNKRVTVSGVNVSDGNGGNNYDITYVDNTTSTISRASITVGSIDVSRTYDGTLAAAGSAVLLGGTLYNNASNAGLQDTLSGGSFAFTNANAGSGKTVTTEAVTVSDGNGGGNYHIVYSANTSSTITPRLLDVAATVADKVYDGGTGATVTGYSFGNLVAGETLKAFAAGGAHFDDRHAGQGKAVTIHGVSLLDGSGLAANYSLPDSTVYATANVSKATLQVAGLLALDKVYDGGTAATLSAASAVLSGTIGDDEVSLSTLSGTFADKNAGVDKPVVLGAFTLLGSDAHNYTLMQAQALQASITPRSLAVTASGQDKTYDGNTTATVTLSDNRLVGDQLGIGYSASFLDKNAGTAKFVDVQGITLSGADAGNYLANSSTSAFASIEQALLMVTASGQDKVYDGSIFATVILSDNRVAGDNLVLGYGSAAFDSAAAGVDKAITVTGIHLEGSDATNYRVNIAAQAQADITARLITISGAQVASKVYDGSTAATLNLANAWIDGLVAGDTVALGSGTGLFASQNAGVDMAVTAQGIGLTGAQAGNYQVQLPTGLTGTITPAWLDGISGITVADKVYDGGVFASFDTDGVSFSGLLAGDSLAIGSAHAAFADKNAGSNKVVTIGQIVLAGADAGNYRFAGSVLAEANITPRALVVTGLAAGSRVYDGSVAASVSTAGAQWAGLLTGDVITISSTGQFADKHVGENKVVNLTSTFSGADAGNYSITSQASTRASITPRALTVSGLMAEDRVYDGSLAASVNTGAVQLVGLVAGDVITLSSSGLFADKHVGTQKPVSLLTHFGGADAGNYSITSQAGASASITPRAVELSGLVVLPKVYDGTAVATVSMDGAVFSGLVEGDVITLDSSGLFDNKNVGEGKTVSLTHDFGGIDAANYTLTGQSSAWANITPAGITLVSGIVAADRVYDGGIQVMLDSSQARFEGLIAGDELDVASAEGRFEDRSAGSGKAVHITQIRLGGSDAGNYRLLVDTATTTASVAPAELVVQVQVQSKLHDGGTEVVVRLDDNRIAGDQLVLGFDSAAFDNALAGLDKAVTVRGVGIVGGADAANYSFTTRDLVGYGAIFDPATAVPRAPQAPATGLEPMTVEPPTSAFDATLPAAATGSVVVPIEPGHDAVHVELLAAAASVDGGLVAVTVPSRLRSFVAPIPKELYEALSEALRSAASVTLESGGALPAWLSFNWGAMALVGTDMPDDGLPLRLALNIGGERTVIVISKAAAQ